MKEPLILRKLADVLKQHPDFSPQWFLPGGGPFVKIANQRGLGEIEQVVVCQPDGTPLWDQPAWTEAIGAVTVVVNKKGEIGLIKNFRPIPLEAGVKATYPERAAFGQHGRVFWEVPRGFPVKAESPEQAAVRKTAEKIGLPVLNVEKIGEFNANNAFFVHNIPVFVAEVDEDWQGKVPGDINEKIFQVKFYRPEEVKRMIKDGRIQCALSLAALQLFFVVRGGD